jgi:hypothetical protein
VAIGEAIPKGARSETFVARKIYQLRNALVHYRPFHQRISLKQIDWNRLCESMALLALHVYGEIGTGF